MKIVSMPHVMVNRIGAVTTWSNHMCTSTPPSTLELEHLNHIVIVD
jgi:hypothetical protein